MKLARGLTLPAASTAQADRSRDLRKSAVSLEHQQRGHRYVVRGGRVSGAVEEIGHYVTFSDPGRARPLVWLHPLDSVGVNGVHALVIASTLVRVEMLRVGHTYDLFIPSTPPGLSITGNARHWKARFCFVRMKVSGAGFGEEEQGPERIGHAGLSLAGWRILPVPVEFEAVVKAITGAAACIGCRHSHYLQGARPRR